MILETAALEIVGTHVDVQSTGYSLLITDYCLDFLPYRR